MAIACGLFKLTLPWLLLVPGAWAQTPVASATSRPAPAARAATMGAAALPQGASGLHYVSVMGQYQAYAEQAPTPWPQANATVQGIGGWRAYAREAASPPPAPPGPGAQP